MKYLQFLCFKAALFMDSFRVLHIIYPLDYDTLPKREHII